MSSSSATIYPSDTGIVVRSISSPSISDPPSFSQKIKKSYTAPPAVQSPPSSSSPRGGGSGGDFSGHHSSLLYSRNGEEGHAGWWPSPLGQGFYLSQHTSECCKVGPCQPEIDWDIGQYSMDPATNRMRVHYVEKQEHVLFVKEHATWCSRTFSCIFPGGRATK